MEAAEKKSVFYKAASWFMVIFLAGFISGIFFAQKMVIERRLQESVMIGGIVLDNTVYNLIKR